VRRLLFLTALAILALPTMASAADRYASPAGGTALGCPAAEPCSLAAAITGAGADDVVIVTPGTYKVASTIEATVPLSIHGLAGQPRPRIVGAAKVTPLKSGEPVSLGDLAFEATEAGLGVVFAFAKGDVFDHLELIAHGLGTLSLRPGVSFTLTDSLLAGDGEGAGGLFVQGVETGASVLRNDSVVSNGPGAAGISIFVVNPAATVTMNATNVITGSASAEATPGGKASIFLDHSNVATIAGTITATDNQTAPPLFVNPAAGDYREAAGSPTIDGGINDPANGATDLLGNARALPGSLTCGSTPPAITDIGAFEYVSPAPNCTQPTAPPTPKTEKRQRPQTRISATEIRSHRAKFLFTGSGGGAGTALAFACKLDRRPWRACRSPKVYRHLALGRHTFRVRAIDGSAVDLTPAKRQFKIEPPHPGPRAG
jgi:hypothetical protein